uniref:Uncharacterized protein n=1 Tax=Neogobius melanostomus TaxID=47308 RepID=A0A8C6S4T1_9GOBI
RTNLHNKAKKSKYNLQNKIYFPSPSQLACFSLKERFFVRFLTNSFLSVLPKKKDSYCLTIAVASLVSLSAFGFLWSFSIFRSVKISPLLNKYI